MLGICDLTGGDGGHNVIRWRSVTNHVYSILRSTNLMTGFDVTVATNLPATPPVNVHTDQFGAGESTFYLIRVLSP